MPSHFDTDAEDAKLAYVRAEEEEDLTRILSDKYGITYTDLSVVPINMDALRVIGEAEAKDAQAIAFDKNGKHLSVALRDPKSDTYTRLRARLTDAGYILEEFLVSEAGITRGISRYADLSQAHGDDAGVFAISEDDVKTLGPKLSTVALLRDYLTEAISTKHPSQISTLLEDILVAALTMKASDIHFEPGEDGTRLRLRLDGILTDTFLFNEHSYRLLSSRIKLLSGLKLNISDRAQDGRFSIGIGAIEVEIRTSSIPGNYGESIVLRVLDPNATTHSFTDMGIHPKLLKRLEAEIRRPTGMLLTTGPTGSGKTTTLYAFMRAIHTPEIKIVTIEDPVEYHLPGIVQTQVNGEDYTFASGLRSVLRQDPDVIMVGEIRDGEVAEVAIQAALTGHFVFSTLHTNNAAGAFPRLADLGIDPKSFASAVTVAMAQRLVRTLDPATRVKRAATDEEKKIMQRIFEGLSDPSLMPASFDEVWSAATGEDSDTGYKGRTGLVEAIFMDEELGEFLRDNPSSSDIAKHVERQGYLTMAQDGVTKALSGITSLEEVFKVIDLPRD
ncbi:MAG: GspE/PulE family protein [Patescibacteria group bacterium]